MARGYESSEFDLIVEEVLDLMRATKAELRERSRRKKPFRQEPIDDKQALVEYDELTPERREWRRQEFGDEATLPYFQKMESIRRRYQGNGGK